MTLRELIINNNLGFQRQDSDEVIVTEKLDFEMKIRASYDYESDFIINFNNFGQKILLEVIE